MADSVTYVYAVTRDLDENAVKDLEGIDGSVVRLIVSGDIAALASTVDSEEFSEQGLRENLEKMPWLEKVVRDHNRVVDTVAGTSAVAPLGLATVYFSDDRVRSVLAERAAEFTEILDQITGRTEWGVKAYADLGASAQVGADSTEESPERPGAAYLKRIRQQRESRNEAQEQAHQRAEEVHTRLRELAQASRLFPPQNRELAGYQGAMVLNAAYLVETARNDEFTATVHELKNFSPGFRVELTGPWPAYSFATSRHEDQR